MNESRHSPSPEHTTHPKRIVLLMSTAGGGHKSAAESIAEALTEMYADKVVIESIDVLKEYAPHPFGYSPEAYQLMIKSPRAWKGFYELGDGVRRSKMINSATSLYARRHSERLLDNHQADMIVSAYHFANSPILETLRRRHLSTPFVTVVTDLVTAPPIWFDTRTTLCITPTAETAELALRSGLDPSIIKVIGMPVSERFTPPTQPKPQLKAALGWPADKPAIIAMAGGEGIGSLDQIAEELTTLDATIIVITGKNAQLLKKFSETDNPKNLKVYGFVNNMHQLMQAADLIVTKAGPGTIVEALNSHLPLVLYSKLPGQEDGNVSFVTDHGAGIWQPKIQDMADTIRSILDSPLQLANMTAAAATIAQNGANTKIADTIGKLLNL